MSTPNKLSIGQPLNGRLVNILPYSADPENYVLLCVKINGEGEVHRGLLAFSAFKPLAKKLGLGEDSFRNLRGDKGLSEAERRTMAASSLRVSINLAEGQQPPHPKSAPKLPYTFKAAGVSLDAGSERVDPVLEALARNPGAAVPQAWPEPEPACPFSPVQVPLRVSSYRSQTRLGYAVFDSPILAVTHSNTSFIDEEPLLGQGGSVKKGAGHSYESYTLTYTVQGKREIEEGVRDVLEQIGLTPFISAEGGPFGLLGEEGDLPKRDIAVKEFGLSTVPGLPGALQVDLTVEPFVFDSYCPPSDEEKSPDGLRTGMDDVVCWPLFKLWCKTRARSRYHGKPTLDGRLILSFPTEDAVAEINKIAAAGVPQTSMEDQDALEALALLLEGRKAEVRTRHVKEVIGLASKEEGARYVLLKANSEELFRQLAMTGTSRDHGAYLGLIEWNKFKSFNYVDENGRLLPQSATLDARIWDPRTSGAGSFVQGTRAEPNDLLDISYDSHQGSGLDAAIDAYYDALAPVVSGTNNPVTGALRAAAKARPYDYFAVVLKADPATEGDLASRARALKRRHRTKMDEKVRTLQAAYQEAYRAEPKSTVALSTGPGSSDIIIEQITSKKSHAVAMVHDRINPTPVHSHVGGVDAAFVVRGKCFSRAAKRRLEAIKDTFDKRSLAFNSPLIRQGGSSTGGPFLRVENEVFQLMGVDFVMPLGVHLSSVDGQPGVWDFTLTFLEFDPRTQLAEQIRFLPTTQQDLAKLYQYGNPNREDGNPIAERGREYFSLQGALALEEVRPDLMLPTHGEVRSWITMIAEEARWRLANNRDDKGAKPQRSGRERQLLAYVEEFFPGNLKELSEWEVDTDRYSPEHGAYVDADFYCYYDNRNLFGTAFDTLLKDQLGAPDGNLGAKGPPSIDEGGVTSLYRETDPLFAATSLYSRKFHAVDGANYAQEVTDTLERRTYPEYTKNMRKLAQDTGNQFDANPRRWWDSTITEKGGRGVFVDANPSYVAVERLPASLAMPQILGPETATDDEDRPIGDELLESGIGEFFLLSWRQKKTREAARIGLARPGRVWDQTQGLTEEDDPNFLVPAGNARSLIEIGGFGGGVKFGGGDRATELSLVYHLHQSGAYKGLTGTELLDALASDFSEGTWSQGSAFGDLLTTLIGLLPVGTDNRQAASAYLSTRRSFLQRTVLANSNYRFFRQAGTRAELYGDRGKGGTTQKNFIELLELVDHHAARTGIDPNIVRAFFLRRTGMGATKALGSPQDGGWGDLALDLVGEDQTAGQAIALFCQVFKRHLTRLNGVPTLALLAATAELTDLGRRTHWNGDKLDPDFYDKLLEAAGALSTERRYTKTALDLIQARVKESALGAQIDSYFQAYIEATRFIGAYLDPAIGENWDPLFHPLSPYIVMDVSDNYSYAVTDLTPTGATKALRMNRRVVSARPAENELYGEEDDPDATSAEIDAALSTKLRFALEPHTEGAVYGCLTEMRRTAPFGRLAAAFPAYHVLIINEGFYYNDGSTKFWDQYYTRRGVSSIEVFRSRKSEMPTSTCSIVFSNMFNTVARHAQMEWIRHQMAQQANLKFQESFGGLTNLGKTISDIFQRAILKQPDKEQIRLWHYNQLQHLALSAGARVQVRMGHTMNAAAMPVVFNGTVVDVPMEAGQVAVHAVGDGQELMNPTMERLVKEDNGYAFRNSTGLFGTGTEPSKLVIEAMVSDTMVADITGGRFRDFSKGIAHFGEVYFDNMRHYPAEMMINLYGSSSTKLEQSFGFWERYCNTNAFYNYSGTTLINLSVSEPTAWRIVETCRRAVIDFVASVEPFHTRSTLFFGKWWWPFHYAYDESILDFLPPPRQERLTPSIVFETAAPTLQNAADGSTPDTASPQETPVDPERPVLKIGVGDVLDLPAPIRDYVAQMYGKSYPGITIAQAKAIQVGGERSNIYRWVLLLTDQKGKFGFAIDVEYDISVPVGMPGDPSPIKAVSGQLTFAEAARRMGDVRDHRGAHSEIDQNDVLDLDQEDRERIAGGQAVTITPEERNGPTTRVPRSNAADFIGQDMLIYVQNLVRHLKWRTYMQAWIAHSGINLLTCNIKADESQVVTDAQGTHAWNGFLSRDAVTRTHTYSVDADIQPSSRKTMMVDVGLMVTGANKGLLRSIGDSVGSFVPVVGELVTSTPTTPAVENSVVSALVDQVKEMYQGWFTVRGMGAVKPRDMFLLTDHKTGLTGPVFAKEVIHRMDAQTGFVTMVSPDAVVMPHGSFLGGQLVVALATGPLHRIGAFMIAKALYAGTLGALIGKNSPYTSFRTAGNLAEYERLRTLVSADDLGEAPGLLRNRIDSEINRLAAKADPDEKKRLLALATDAEEAGADAVRLLGIAKEAGVEIQDADFVSGAGDEAALKGKLLRFDIELEAQRLQLLEEIDNNEFLRGIPRQEKEKAVMRMLAKRIDGFMEDNADKLLEGLLDNDGAVLLRKRYLQLSKEAPTPENLREMDALLDRLLDAKGAVPDVSGGSGSRKFYNDMRRLFMPSTRTGGVANYFASMWESSTGSITTVTKGLLSRSAVALGVAGGGTSTGGNSAIGWVRRALHKDPSAWKTPSDEVKRIAWMDSAKEWLSEGKTAVGIGENATDEAKEAARVALKAKAAARYAQASRMATSMARAGSIAAYMGPQAVVKLAADAVLFIIGGSLIEAINSRQRARQAVKIIPLRVGDIPFTAGIRGHQGAVVGDSPGFFDELFMEYLGGKDASNVVSQSISLMAALSGVEVPEFGRTELDTYYLQRMRESGGGR